MKKTVVVEILALFAFCVTFACAIKFLAYAHLASNNISIFEKELEYDQSYNETILLLKSYRATALSYGIPALLASLATIAVMAITAINDFPVFKPLIDKFNAKRAARKEQRAAVKAEQAEAAKQARIEQLQAELDELKKDE